MKGLESSYQSVVDWNKKAGSKWEPEFENVWWDKIRLQTKLLVEEVQETVDASEYHDKVELLDGVVDVFVIWSYLAAQLDKAGYDVVGAIQKIQQNNDTKIFKSYVEAADCAEKLSELKDEHHYVESGYLNGLEFFTVRNSYGKISKPIGFKSVDLSEFLPK